MFIETYFKRGCANAELGKHVLAVMDFDETIRLNPDHEAAIERRRHSLAILDPKENRHPATTELSTEAVSAATDGESTNQWLWGTGLGAVVGWVALGNAPGMMIWGPIVGAMIGSFVGLLVVVWRH